MMSGREVERRELWEETDPRKGPAISCGGMTGESMAYLKKDAAGKHETSASLKLLERFS